MTIEQRIAELEKRLEALQSKPVVRTNGLYAEASKRCEEYFKQVKGEKQYNMALNVCQAITRSAFREKHEVRGPNNTPARYVDTEEKAGEYIALFKEFLTVYQGYLQRG